LPAVLGTRLKARTDGAWLCLSVTVPCALTGQPKQLEKNYQGGLEAEFPQNICQQPDALIGPVTVEGTGSLPVHLVLRLLVRRI
jgi:hypothetical protein